MIRVEMTGVVTDVYGFGLTPAEAEASIGGSIHVGTPFSVSLVIDTSAAPSTVNPATVTGPYESTDLEAVYNFGLPYALHAEIGNYVSDTSTAPLGARYFDVHVLDPEPGQVPLRTSRVFAYLHDAAAPQSGSGYYLVGAAIGFIGTGEAAPFDGISLAGIPWDLGDYEGNFLNWNFSPNHDPFGGAQTYALGSVTSLSSEIVPEPPGAPLAALATLAAVMHLSRRCAASSKT